MNRFRVVVSISLLLLCSGTASAADAVTYWNDKVIGVTIAGGRSNPETGVDAAYMHIAIYDAISSIDGRFTPFLTRVANVPPGASPEAAAAEAAYRILASLYPAASFPAIASQFATAYNDALNAIPNSQAKSDGMAVGLAAANGLIAKRQNDGFRANVPYVFLPRGAGVYQKTPGATASQWSKARNSNATSRSGWRSTTSSRSTTTTTRGTIGSTGNHAKLSRTVVPVMTRGCNRD